MKSFSRFLLHENKQRNQDNVRASDMPATLSHTPPLVKVRASLSGLVPVLPVYLADSYLCLILGGLLRTVTSACSRA